ncbi:MAG: hypothetical protein M1812_004699 [Candelaria pacifica]|nr:MAG: hypothetical protein M1812_004699 [Candelaria pacifica]
MSWFLHLSRYLILLGYLLSTSSCAALDRVIHLSKRQQPDDEFGNPTPSDCRDAWDLMPQNDGTYWYYGGSRGDLPADGEIKPLEVLPREWAMGNCVIRVRLAFDIGGVVGPRFDETNWHTINEMADDIITIVVEAQGKGGFGFPVTRTAHIKVEVFAKNSIHDKKGPAALTVEDEAMTSQEEDIVSDTPTSQRTEEPPWDYIGQTWTEGAEDFVRKEQNFWGGQGQCRAVYCTHDRDCADSCGSGFKCSGGTVLSDAAAALVNFGAMVMSSLGSDVCSNT